MNNNIELNDIKSFITICDQGSFTKAASKLQVTRGHISKQIKNLEEKMNVRLIMRTTRSMSLTDEGQLLYKESKDSLTRIYQAISATLDDAEEISGEININSVGGVIGEDILAPILAEFGCIHPDILINLDFSSSRSNLIGEKYDLILRMGKLDDSNFVAKKVADFEICTLATPEYLKKKGKITHPRDFKELNCLTGSVKKWSFTNNKTKANSTISVKGSFQCPSGKSLLNAAKSGLGVVRLPKIYCADEINKGELVLAINNWSIDTVPRVLVILQQ